MDVARGKVVAIQFTLRGERGELLQQVVEPPLYYLHGAGNIVAGLEEALEGLKPGDSFEATVPPEQGFGSHDEKLLTEIPLNQVPAGVKPMRGQRLQLTFRDKQQRAAKIVKVRLKTVVIDANHELVDRTLHYAGRVQQVREATRLERTHRHAHAPKH